MNNFPYTKSKEIDDELSASIKNICSVINQITKIGHSLQPCNIIDEVRSKSQKKKDTQYNINRQVANGHAG